MRFVAAAFAAFTVAVAAASGASAQTFGQKTSSLYVRGDVGGAFSTHTEFKDTDGSAADASLGSTQLAGDSDNSVLFEGGLGLQLNTLLRFDITAMAIPYFKFRTTNTTAATQASASMTNWTGMLNGYLELNKLFYGLFGSTEPYLDGGIGFADNQLDHMTIVNASGNTSLAATDHFSLAYAAGAGIGFPLGRDLKLDVAYRYLFLGDLETGTTKTDASGTSGPTTASKADLQAHTVMIGLRYTFYNFDM